MRRAVPLLLLMCFMCLAACSLEQDPAPVRHYGAGAQARGTAGSMGMHTVRAGETLRGVARAYNLTPEDLAVANALPPPFILRVGQRLALPPPVSYTVRPGDTLYAVARVTGAAQSAIARMNGLDPPYAIRPGQVLRLPRLARPEVGAKAAPPPFAASAPVAEVSNVALPQSQGTAGTRGFLRPVTGGSVLAPFGPQAGGVHNDGVNIAAPRGTPVRAARAGTVAYAGNGLPGLGNLVLLQHPGGWVTAYAHLDQLEVAEGQRLVKGQRLGTVGSTGAVDTPQIHFEIRKGTQALDPTKHI